MRVSAPPGRVSPTRQHGGLEVASGGDGIRITELVVHDGVELHALAKLSPRRAGEVRADSIRGTEVRVN